jgi:hypothetical protein
LLAFYPTIVKINLKSIPYSTRLIKMDWVGVEATTSAAFLGCSLISV